MNNYQPVWGFLVTEKQISCHKNRCLTDTELFLVVFSTLSEITFSENVYIIFAGATMTSLLFFGKIRRSNWIEYFSVLIQRRSRRGYITSCENSERYILPLHKLNRFKDRPTLTRATLIGRRTWEVIICLKCYSHQNTKNIRPSPHMINVAFTGDWRIVTVFRRIKWSDTKSLSLSFYLQPLGS